MSWSRWRGVRLTASSGRCLLADQYSGSGQKLQETAVATSNLSCLVRIRGISSTVVHSSGNDGGNGGPWEPLEESVVRDKDSPDDETGEKRMWRKWIEERLSHSGTDEVSESLVRKGPPVIETSSKSPMPEKESGPRFSRSAILKENGKPSSVPGEDGNVEKRSPWLDSLFSTALKQSTNAGNAEDSKTSNFRNPFRQENASSRFFPDRGSSNSSFASNRGSSFQESSKQQSFFSGKHLAAKAPREPVGDIPVEALDEFENRVLGSANDADEAIDDDFLRDLDEIGRSARGIRDQDDDNVESEEDEDWGDERVQGLTDLALSNSQEFDLEDEENPYRMRSDRLFFPGQTYDPEDLDLSKEADVEKPTVRTRKKYPSKEVFKIADFRNPRFLSNFIRESSRLLPKRHFRISAKAQRKVAKEIKTARILGLMPFTSMGDPPFRFLRSRSDEDTSPTSYYDGF